MIRLFSLAVLLIAPHSLWAAEITIAPQGMPCIIALNGPIELGDRDRMRAVMTQVEVDLPSGALSAAAQQEGRRICLNSSGGALAEGVALAVLFNDNVFGTIVPRNASCLSACAIAFMGGAGFVSQIAS